MYIVPNGNIYVDVADCNKQQTLEGIFITAKEFRATDNPTLARRGNVIENTDGATPRCRDGRLKISGVLAGNGVLNLVNARRSALNEWFTIAGRPSRATVIATRRNQVYDGASLLIETNTSLWSDLPPGAADLDQLLKVFR